jgi:hypothetical protein
MHTIQPLSAAQVLARIQHDYHALLKSGTTFSIASMLNFDDFKIEAYCRSYKSHADAAQLIAIVQAFSEEYGIWLPDARHHITCTLFLYPNATFDRMVTMMQNLTIDFYLNDVMGRDVFRYLSPAEQEQAKSLIERMGNVDERLSRTGAVTPIEKANLTVLGKFKDTATADWFKRFITCYSYHIGVTHKDGNAVALGYIPGVEAYIAMRCHYGGMYHIITWAEYSTGNFLNWKWLETKGLVKQLERLHEAVAKFGALSNDLFSFEKEVIDNNSDANLLMVTALNAPGKSLTEVIHTAAATVQGFLKEYIWMMEVIKNRCLHLPASAMLNMLKLHLLDLELVMQACWMWQVHTLRYKHASSVFLETVLEDE